MIDRRVFSTPLTSLWHEFCLDEPFPGGSSLAENFRKRAINAMVLFCDANPSCSMRRVTFYSNCSRSHERYDLVFDSHLRKKRTFYQLNPRLARSRLLRGHFSVWMHVRREVKLGAKRQKQIGYFLPFRNSEVLIALRSSYRTQLSPGVLLAAEWSSPVARSLPAAELADQDVDRRLPARRR